MRAARAARAALERRWRDGGPKAKAATFGALAVALAVALAGSGSSVLEAARVVAVTEAAERSLMAEVQVSPFGLALVFGGLAAAVLFAWSLSMVGARADLRRDALARSEAGGGEQVTNTTNGGPIPPGR